MRATPATLVGEPKISRLGAQGLLYFDSVWFAGVIYPTVDSRGLVL